MISIIENFTTADNHSSVSGIQKTGAELTAHFIDEPVRGSNSKYKKFSTNYRGESNSPLEFSKSKGKKSSGSIGKYTSSLVTDNSPKANIKTAGSILKSLKK